MKLIVYEKFNKRSPPEKAQNLENTLQGFGEPEKFNHKFQL